MPELPEVEIIKLGLQKKIIGLKIQEIQILSPKSFIGNPDLASGQKVLRIWRRAKLLGIDLVGNKLLAISNSPLAKSKKPIANSVITLLFHMKMSGQLIWEGNSKFIGGHPTEDMTGKMPNSHTRVIFTFSDKSHLYFNDQRKFGWVKVIDNVQLTMDSFLKNLGPEPLEKEFTWQVLKSNLLKHKSMAVKVAIMDQSVVSGVGNIYASEACFDAKIDPRIKVGQMTNKQFQALYHGVIRALREGIKHGGSTIAHFVDAEGRKGYFIDYANVYGKEGYACKGCPGKVKKISLGGRGTYLCPSCQK